MTLRGEELFRERWEAVLRRTDLMFARLMAVQWLFGIALAVWISPLAWAGEHSELHLHVYAAVILGGLITSLPVFLAATRPGEAATRHAIAVGQMLTSALLIHLTGGRIETHFHVFGSLAFLAFYRDWRVLATATAVVALDHGLRGVFWPLSVYGVPVIQAWRFVEHTAWVLFEDAFLVFAARESLAEMRAIAERQAELETMNETVEKRVVERTLELARSNADLERFAYAASHDLQEPLRKVTTFTELLSLRYRGRLDAEADRFIRGAVDGAGRMGALIDSLLTYSRVGKEERPAESASLDALFDRVIGDLEFRIHETGALVTRGTLPALPVRPTQVTQLFLNLISNGLKFRGAEAPRVHVGASLADGEWVFRVRDNGIGIAPDHAGQLFVLFKRLHSRAEFPGSGIGLAICKKIVENHGGRIWIEAAPGRGSVFCFTLSGGRARTEAKDAIETHTAHR